MTPRKRTGVRKSGRRFSRQRGAGFMDSLRNVGARVYGAVWKPESEQEKLRKKLLDFKPALPLTVNKSPDLTPEHTSQKAGVRRRRSRRKVGRSKSKGTKRKGGHVWSNLSAGRGVNGNMTVFKYNPRMDTISSKTTPNYNVRFSQPSK